MYHDLVEAADEGQVASELHHQAATGNHREVVIFAQILGELEVECHS
jgi:hypothetical protein